MRHWPRHGSSARRPTCRSPRIWRKASATRPKSSRRRSDWRRRASSAVRSRTQAAAPIYELGQATERIAAAAAAARSLPFPFTLTGRTENFLRGRADLDDTIKRLKAYEAAGADALMAPGLPDLEAVRAVCAAVGKPFNFMAGIKGKSFTVAALTAAGVKRISLATSLYRAAMTGLMSAAKEVREHGTFGYIDTSLGSAEMNEFLRE